MCLASLYEFLCTNEVTENNAGLIKNHLSEIESEAWAKGYKACLSHEKKRRALKKASAENAVKRFLDFLSDLTHSPQKQS